MYARIEYKQVARSHVTIQKDKLKLLAAAFNVAPTTVRKYLSDVFNENITAQKRNEVVVAAINQYGGKLHEERTWKNVLIVDKNDHPRNHQ